MDMSTEGMNMGAMPMGPGIPSLASFQKNYWTIVGCAIGVGTAVNILNQALYRQRYANCQTT